MGRGQVGANDVEFFGAGDKEATDDIGAKSLWRFNSPIGWHGSVHEGNSSLVLGRSIGSIYRVALAVSGVDLFCIGNA